MLVQLSDEAIIAWTGIHHAGEVGCLLIVVEAGNQLVDESRVVSESELINDLQAPEDPLKFGITWYTDVLFVLELLLLRVVRG